MLQEFWYSVFSPQFTGVNEAEDDREEREERRRTKKAMGVRLLVGWAKGMIASGPLPCVIADTPRSTRAPDPLHLHFLPACLLVAASLSLSLDL
jgi:hypothetical protein